MLLLLLDGVVPEDRRLAGAEDAPPENRSGERDCPPPPATLLPPLLPLERLGDAGEVPEDRPVPEDRKFVGLVNVNADRDEFMAS